MNKLSKHVTAPEGQHAIKLQESPNTAPGQLDYLGPVSPRWRHHQGCSYHTSNQVHDPIGTRLRETRRVGLSVAVTTPAAAAQGSTQVTRSWRQGWAQYSC